MAQKDYCKRLKDTTDKTMDVIDLLESSADGMADDYEKAYMFWEESVSLRKQARDSGQSLELLEVKELLHVRECRSTKLDAFEKLMEVVLAVPSVVEPTLNRKRETENHRDTPRSISTEPKEMERAPYEVLQDRRSTSMDNSNKDGEFDKQAKVRKADVEENERDRIREREQRERLEKEREKKLLEVERRRRNEREEKERQGRDRNRIERDRDRDRERDKEKERERERERARRERERDRRDRDDRERRDRDDRERRDRDDRDRIRVRERDRDRPRDRERPWDRDKGRIGSDQGPSSRVQVRRSTIVHKSNRGNIRDHSHALSMERRGELEKPIDGQHNDQNRHSHRTSAGNIQDITVGSPTSEETDAGNNFDSSRNAENTSVWNTKVKGNSVTGESQANVIQEVVDDDEVHGCSAFFQL